MNKTILLIENDKLLRSNFSDLLELEGFNVLSAEDGWLGLNLAKIREFSNIMEICLAKAKL